MQGPTDLVLEQNHNPLKRQVPVVDPTHEYTDNWLAEFKSPLNIEKARKEPYVMFLAASPGVLRRLPNFCSRILRDRINSGWLSWRKTYDAYLTPDFDKYPFPHGDEASKEAVAVVREVAHKASFWKELSTHYSSENNAEVIVQDDVSCVKSICKPFAQSESAIHDFCSSM